jgi:hypothetical protein
VFGFSFLRAQWAVHAASERTQAIWSRPEGVNPATLPEEDRLALLALIKARQRPQHKFGPVVELSPEEAKQLKPAPPEPQADLVRQFLRVSKDRAVASGAIVDELKSGDWIWVVDPGSTWSDNSGDEWWFVDPATEEKADRSLSDIEAEMEWPAISVALALLFSVPWLCFLLARVREISDAVRTKTRD